jgi:hypothetical protein
MGTSHYDSAILPQRGRGGRGDLAERGEPFAQTRTKTLMSGHEFGKRCLVFVIGDPTEIRGHRLIRPAMLEMLQYSSLLILLKRE